MRKKSIMTFVCIAMILSSCADTYNPGSNKNQSDGTGGLGLILGLVAVAALARAATCRPAGASPIIGGGGGYVYHTGTC